MTNKLRRSAAHLECGSHAAALMSGNWTTSRSMAAALMSGNWTRSGSHAAALMSGNWTKSGSMAAALQILAVFAARIQL